MQPFKFPSYIIQRESYTSRIEPFMTKPIAKVFTGQRRVGKSFMLFQIMQLILKKEPKANIIYINKEDIAFDEIKTASDLNKYIIVHSSDEKMNYIFIDEIQEINDFLKSQQVNISHNQVQTFNDYFTNAFLIHKVPRYDVQGKRIFEFGEKYYFENCGIRNAIVGYVPGDKAKLLENIVYNQLLYKGYDVKIGWLETQEINFVATKNNETIYVQVALRLDNDKTIEREFGNLLKINDNYPKMVIAMDEQFKNTYKGITYLPIRKFLMN